MRVNLLEGNFREGRLVPMKGTAAEHFCLCFQADHFERSGHLTRCADALAALPHPVDRRSSEPWHQLLANVFDQFAEDIREAEPEIAQQALAIRDFVEKMDVKSLTERKTMAQQIMNAFERKAEVIRQKNAAKGQLVALLTENPDELRRVFDGVKKQAGCKSMSFDEFVTSLKAEDEEPTMTTDEILYYVLTANDPRAAAP